MNGFRRPFEVFRKNINPSHYTRIRYIGIDITDIDVKREAAHDKYSDSASTTWNIDPAHSVAEFKVKHMMIANVKGQFPKVSGALFLNESDLANSHVEASIEAVSIHTRDDQRDAHLRSADFLDVEKFPTLTFKSKGIRIVRDRELSVEGDLTIHGVTRNVRFMVEGPTPPAKDPWGNTRAAISASTKINRKDFGLTWKLHSRLAAFWLVTRSRSLLMWSS